MLVIVFVVYVGLMCGFMLVLWPLALLACFVGLDALCTLICLLFRWVIGCGYDLLIVLGMPLHAPCLLVLLYVCDVGFLVYVVAWCCCVGCVCVFFDCLV